MNWVAIIRQYRIAGLNPTLVIKEFDLSLISLIRGIYNLHELQYVHLLMTMLRNCRTYGNDLAQWLIIIRVIKNIVVHNVDNTFIVRLLLKSAASSLCHTLFIQNKKNSTTGNIINRN